MSSICCSTAPWLALDLEDIDPKHPDGRPLIIGDPPAYALHYWNGERLLPEGYVRHVSTVAPAWVADGRPIYGGGFMWVNGDGANPFPRDAYSMLGAGGQSATVIPSHDLVVVRLGKYRGSAAGDVALDKLYVELMKIVPASR